MFKGNNKDARATSMLPLLLTFNKFVNHFSGFSITALNNNISSIETLTIITLEKGVKYVQS